MNSVFTPLVSIIMPVYNSARTLQESIDSVLEQTFSDFELIICNDGSNDETQTILNKIKDKRVHILHNKNNSGAGFSRDRGIESTRGKWLAVIDADDAWAPERLAALLQEAARSSDIIIFDDIFECHDTAKGLVPWRVLRGKYAFGGNGYTCVEVPIEDYVSQNRLLIKPLLPLNHIKKYNVHHGSRRFAEDTEFFLNLLVHGLKLWYVPKPMYYYRITPGSMTGLSDRSTMMREVLEKAIVDFDNSPSVQAALRQKVLSVVRDEQYMPFICAINNWQIKKAIQMTYQYPWIITELLRRLWFSAGYHISRIKSRGRSRGIVSTQ